MITVTNLGYQYVNIGGIDIDRTNNSDEFLFLFLRKPTEIWIDNGYQLIPENTFFLYPPGTPQIYRKLDGHFINDWIHFSINPYENYFEELHIPFNTPMTLADPKPITEMISDLFIEYFNIGEQHLFIMEQKAHALFHKYSDMYHFTQNNSPKIESYLNEFIHLRKKIQNFEYHPKNIQEVAKTLNMSTSYFQHLYKDFFGVNINHDIISGRIEHASHLLNGTSYSVAEISKLCGYENTEHFSRQFKKLKGNSPTQYRNQLKK